MNVRTISAVALGLALVVNLGLNLGRPAQAHAVSINNTINFQARLETAAGAIVPDGSYNVEFNLYSGSSGGSSLWTEDYLYNGGSPDQRIQVVNGYLTTSLGSLTGFPGTINWNQPLWLTMKIGGSGTSPSWDAEMSPRLQLTAVPYAFRAGQLADPGGSGASLTWATQTAANSILLPNAGGTICLQSSSSCGFAASTGAGGYIQNQTLSPQSAGFNISGDGTLGGNLSAVAGTFTGAFQDKVTSTTAFQIQNSGGSGNLFVADTTNTRIGIGASPANSLLTVGTNTNTSTGGITFGTDTNLYRSNSGELTTTGNLIVSNLQANSSVFAGSNYVLSDGSVNFGGIVKTMTAASNVNDGDVVVLTNASGTAQVSTTTTARDTHVYGVSDTTVTSGGAARIVIGGHYSVNADTVAVSVGDQLVTSTTAGKVTVDNSATTGIVGIATTAKAGGSSGTVGIYVKPVGGQYNPTFRNASNSSTAFQIQDTGGTSALVVDTNTDRLAVGPSAVPANSVLTVGTSSTTTASGGIYFGTDTNLYRSGSGALTTSGSLTIQGANALTLGSTSNPGAIVLQDGTSNNRTVTLQATGLAGSYSLKLPTSAPATSKCLQTDSSDSTQLVFGSCSGSGGLAKNAVDTSSFAVASGYLYTFTNSSSAVTSGVLKLDNGSNTNSTLTVTSSGNPGSGQALIFASNTNASPSGNLLDLQSGSSPSSVFNVTSAGSVNLAGGQTIAGGGNLTLTASSTNTLAVDTVGAGTVALGHTHAGTISIGNSTSGTAVTVDCGASATNCNFGTTANAHTTTIGSSNSTSSTVIQGGSNGASIDSSGAVNVGNSNATSVVIGNTANSTITENIKNSNTSAFLLQTAGSVAYLTADTSNSKLVVGATGGTPILLVLANKNTSGDPTPVDGAMYYNSSTGTFRCGQGTIWVSCVGGLVSSATSASSAVNTCQTACVAFSNSGVTIPANYCSPGRVIHIFASGIYSTNSGTTPSLDFGVYIGTDGTTTGQTNDVLLGNGVGMNTQSGASNDPWTVDFYITCQSAGTSGSVIGQGTEQDNKGNATSFTSTLTRASSITATVNTTVSNKLYLFPAWATSNAANTATCEQFIVTST